MSINVIKNMVHDNLTSYRKKHENAMLVMFPAEEAVAYVHGENINFENFIIQGIAYMMKSAMYRGWDEPLAKACKDFCHICMVDPKLVEAYIGQRFEEFCADVYEYLAADLARSVITADGKVFKPRAFL